MIKFFRQSYAAQYVVLFLLAVALWVPVFVTGQVHEGLTSPVTPLYNLLSRILGVSPVLKLSVAFLLMVFEALFFNSMLIANQIVTKVSTMGAFVFLMFMNLTLTQSNFFPFAMAMVFILMALHTCFMVYQISGIEFYLINVGVFIALASMCYFPAIFMLLWVVAALLFAHSSSMRLQCIPLVGFLFVYMAYFSARFFMGDLPEVLQGYADYFTGFSLSVSGFNGLKIAVLAVVSLFSMVPSFNNKSLAFEKTVAVRSKLSMTIVMYFLSVFTLFLGGDPLLHGLIFVPLAIFASYELSYLNKTAVANIWMYAFVILVLLNRYFFKML